MEKTRDIRYFDHAATSWPKPAEVVEAVNRALTETGGNPGRGAHTFALAATRAVSDARIAVASLLGIAESRDVFFVPGCTEALNLVLKGTLAPGDRVVVSSVEHNAIVRPLTVLAAAGVEVVKVRGDAEGRIDPDDVETAVRQAPTRAVICQHASNVTGAIQPVGDLADIAHDNGAVMIVDGAQAAGHLALDLSALGADAYAVAGHKGLLGPQGIGVLYLAPGFEPTELVQGGGGADAHDPSQPKDRPERYEAGTGNTPGAIGLGAAASLLAHRGAEIRATERRLTRALHEGLLGIPGVTVLGPPPGEARVPVVSVTVTWMGPDELAATLDRRYGIMTRAGVHCSPWTHETVGTGAAGAVRFAPGHGTTDDDIAAALDAMGELAK